MRADLERRDADVGGRQARGHVGVRQGAGEDDVGEAGGFVLHGRQLGAVADEHRTDVGAAAGLQARASRARG